MTLEDMRRQAAQIACAAIAAGFLFTPQTSADVVQTTGKAKLVNAPFSAENDDFESNRRIRVFQEAAGVTLTDECAVDFFEPGWYRNNPRRNRGTLEAGTVVDSFMIHQDSANEGVRLKGTVKFDSDIIGVIVSKSRLMDCDLALGSEGTLYEGSRSFNRGLEMRRGADKIKISANLRTITFNLYTSDALDEIRVITAAASVPAPGSIALLSLAGVVAFGRRRRA